MGMLSMKGSCQRPREVSLEEAVALVHAAGGNPSWHRSGTTLREIGPVWELLSCRQQDVPMV